MIFDFKNLSAYGQALKTASTDVGELSKLTSNLTLAQTANALTTKNLTTQEMTQILVNKGLTKAEAEATAAKIASAKANGVATFSLKAYTFALWENIKAIGAWMFTNPVGWVIGLGIAIGGAVIAYNYFNETIEEQKEKISELNTEYENTVQELETLGDEIEKNTKRLDELLDKDRKGTITLVEEDELKKLILANKLLREQEIIAKQEKVDAAIQIYGEIATSVNKANNAFNSLKTILNNARSAYQDIIDLHIASGGKGMSSASITFPEYHSGGIVNSSNKLPENLMALTESNLKPNETFAKLLNGEVVLNNNQMGNMFDNLKKAYSSITPLNKRENSPVEITIGDVNVYNPDNSDMIVNEIVKELPLKVIQKLHSK